jgi:hypothetical protein
MSGRDRLDVDQLPKRAEPRAEIRSPFSEGVIDPLDSHTVMIRHDVVGPERCFSEFYRYAGSAACMEIVFVITAYFKSALT